MGLNIILNCIEVYLDFNYNYNLVFLRWKEKNVFFLIKWANSFNLPIHGGLG